MAWRPLAGRTRTTPSTASSGLDCLSGEQERGHKYTCLHARTRHQSVGQPTGVETRCGSRHSAAPPLTRGRWQAALPDVSGLQSPCAWRRRQHARARDGLRRASRSVHQLPLAATPIAVSCTTHMHRSLAV
jgi:hypothetical protein